MVQISQRIYLSHILYENEYKYRYGEKKNELVQFTFANVNTGNKLYSPQTCCFVPTEINSAFTIPQEIFRNINK